MCSPYIHFCIKIANNSSNYIENCILWYSQCTLSSTTTWSSPTIFSAEQTRVFVLSCDVTFFKVRKAACFTVPICKQQTHHEHLCSLQKQGNPRSTKNSRTLTRVFDLIWDMSQETLGSGSPEASQNTVVLLPSKTVTSNLLTFTFGKTANDKKIHCHTIVSKIIIDYFKM